MTQTRTGWDLPVRVMVLLTLALLPLGYLGVIQTGVLAETSEVRLRLSLIAATEAVTQGETQMLERALGAAESLSGPAGQLADDPATCSAAMIRFLRHHPTYSFAGFLEISGRMRCGTVSEDLDFSLDPGLASLQAAPVVAIRPEPNSIVDQSPVAMVFAPVHGADDTLIGHIVLSIPAKTLAGSRDMENAQAPLGMAIYTREGRILQVQGRAPDIGALQSLGDLWALEAAATQDVIDGDGVHRIAVVLPMIPGQVHAVALWPRAEAEPTLLGFALPARLFPVLMWLASLAVAYLAIHRLVVRHIQRLDGQMAQFGRHRKIFKPQDDPAIPAEIRALEATFQGMALDLISEEARMEDALREKNILIKEVHHRVKNNLQLISSIMNLQLRDIENPETRTILRRLQDRVRGLATVYGYLYQTDRVERTSAAQLLEDVFGQVLDPDTLPKIGIEIEQHFDDAALTADQAVPLALLASELAANALTTVLTAPDEAHRIALRFEHLPGRRARLACRNSLPRSASDQPPEGEGGLGSKLVQAFAQQLNATPHTDIQDGQFNVTITFDLQDFEFEDRSY